MNGDFEALGPSVVHVWYQQTDQLLPDAVPIARACLSPDEQARADRFAAADDRRDYVLAHSLLRHALSRYGAVPAGDWAFDAGEGGKPRLAETHRDTGLTFNLSHTRGLVACAIGRGGDIGVDVERLNRAVDDRDIARRFFAATESAWLDRCEPASRASSFIELWTLKEAYVKAKGQGLAEPLDGFSFQWRESAGLQFERAEDDGGIWAFALFEPCQWARMAVAIRRPVACDQRFIARVWNEPDRVLAPVRAAGDVIF